MKNFVRATLARSRRRGGRLRTPLFAGLIFVALANLVSLYPYEATLSGMAAAYATLIFIWRARANAVVNGRWNPAGLLLAILVACV